ncbi:MAG: metallophosphoesterase family protein [Chloroflexi bacterium]|nr:metallophosphoesterase family protein [Chloroflexota bacterium]
MKLAILSDVHANLAALEAVVEDIDRWQPDRVIVAGDVINRGPRPRECLDLVLNRVRTHGWQCVLGNHEEYVLTHAAPHAPRSGRRFELHRNSFWTYQQVQADLATLAAWPFQFSVWQAGSEARSVHASMLGTRAGIYRETPEADLREKIAPPHAPPPSVLIAGHTHKPLIRTIDQTLVINVGAVGLPFDGDARAGYGQVTWHGGQWQAEVMRVPYDRARADRDFEITGYLDQVGPMGYLIRDELARAQSNLAEWAAVYEQPVLRGELTLAESVRRYFQGQIPPVPAAPKLAAA